MRINAVKSVRTNKIISESQAGNPCALSIQLLLLEVKPGKPVNFPNQNHFRESGGKLLCTLNTNLLLEVKPDRTCKLPQSKSFPRTKQGKPVRSHMNPSFGGKAGHAGTLPSRISSSESHTSKPGMLS